MAKQLGSFIEELKYKCDITDVIGKYITLNQRGRNYWGCCPFHHEKTPSFAVNPDDQYYHCFGCKASGDVIKFVQELESITFMESVTLLCEQYGVKIPESILFEDEKTIDLKKQRDRIYALLKEAAKYYHNTLRSSGQEVLKYLEKRGITNESIVKFGLGFAKDYNGLPYHLKKLGFTDEEMINSGTALSKDGRLYDPLGNRLIVPIINAYGDVIAFGGRDLTGEAHAKYKNTAETIAFNKSRNLYAINLLKKQKQEKGIDSSVIVEGYMDVIALNQAGFKNVVASMGTALTKEQAKLLKRYSENVVICYDGDSAGQMATMRGLDILKAEGLNVLVVDLPEGNDPDEFIAKFGRDAFFRLLKEAPPLTDFKLSVLAKQFDLTTTDGKRKYTKKALGFIAEEPDLSIREELLKVLRTKTEITLEYLKRELENINNKKEASVSSENRMQDSAVLSSASGDSAITKAVRFILNSVLRGDRNATDYEKAERFITLEAHIAVYKYIADCKRNDIPMRASALFEVLPAEGHPEAVAILESGVSMDTDQRRKYYRDCLKLIINEGYESSIKLLMAEFERETDNEKRKEIARQLQATAMEQKKHRIT